MIKLPFAQFKIGANKSLLGMFLFVIVSTSVHHHPSCQLKTVLTVRYNVRIIFIIFIYCKKIMIHDDAWCSTLSMTSYEKCRILGQSMIIKHTHGTAKTECKSIIYAKSFKKVWKFPDMVQNRHHFTVECQLRTTSPRLCGETSNVIRQFLENVALKTHWSYVTVRDSYNVLIFQHSHIDHRQVVAVRISLW